MAGQEDFEAVVLPYERKVEEITSILGLLSFPDKSGYRSLHNWYIVLHLTKEQRAHQWIVRGNVNRVFVHDLCFYAFGS